MTDVFDLFAHDNGNHLPRLAKALSQADGLRGRRLRLTGTNLLGLQAVDVGEVIRQALGQYAALVRAAKRTQDDPQTTERVPLGDLPISYDGTVELVVSKAGIELATFPTTVGLAIELVEAIGEVQSGVLRRLDCRTVEVRATLTMVGQTLATRPARLSPEIVIQLGHGLPLLPTYP